MRRLDSATHQGDIAIETSESPLDPYWIASALILVVIIVPLTFVGVANWRYGRKERKLALRRKPKIDL